MRMLVRKASASSNIIGVPISEIGELDENGLGEKDIILM